MASTLRTQIGIGILALAGVAAVSIVAWQQQAAGMPGPANLLPADLTIAMFTVSDPAHTTYLRSWFPVLDGTPDMEAGDTLAIVTTDTGPAWILLHPDTTPGAENPYLVTTSAASPLSFADSAKLSDTPVFRLLASDTKKDQTSGYIDVTRLPAGQRKVGGWLEPDGPMAFVFDSTHISLRFTDTSRTASRRAAPRLSMGTGTLFALTASDTESLMTAHALLADDATLMTDSLVRGGLRSLFGPDMSPAYDLAPVLDNDIRLRVEQGTHPAVALQAQAPDRDTLEETLASLHTFAASGRPVFTREQRTFDDGLTMDSLRLNDTGSSASESVDGDWTLRTTGSQGSSMFATADRGRTFILASTFPVLASMLNSADVVVPGGLENSVDVSVRGYMRPAALHTTLSSFFPGFAVPPLPFASLAGDGGLEWTWQRTRGRLEITLTPR